jgi:hypothetical protein
MHRSVKEGMGLIHFKGIIMNNNMFEIVIGDKSYSSQEFRTLCKYFDVTLSIYSDGMLDALVAQWNMVMPISQKAVLLFDGEPSGGFKRKVSMSNREDCGADGWVADPRRSGGKY